MTVYYLWFPLVGVLVVVGLCFVAAAIQIGYDKFDTWMRQQHVRAYVRSQDSGSDDGARFCLLLRSSKFDEETSVARPWEPIRIHDEAESGLFNFRAHLTTSMQPIFVKTAKNAEYFLETASVNYPDDDWRSGVLADMRASRFILIAPHWSSDSLRWELEQVIRRAIKFNLSHSHNPEGSSVMKPSSLLGLLFSALVLPPFVANAAEIPQIKPGLWEIRMQASNNDSALKASPVTQICWDAATLADSARKVEASKKQDCSTHEVHREGNKWIENAVCKSGGSTISGRKTRELVGDNAYRDENTATYDPPLRGSSRLHSIIEGKWLGPC